MMNKKKTLFILLIPFVIIVIIIATYTISISYYINYVQFREEARRVRKEPDERYISIKNLEEDANGKLKYWICYGTIEFFDSDNYSIYKIDLNDNYSIVRYKGEHYIHVAIYDYIVDNAIIIAEQRNRIYCLKEPIILRSSIVLPYVVVISSVESENVGDSELNIIKFTTNPHITEKDIVKIFGHIETDKGTKINDFNFIDEGTVQVQIPENEKINMIVLKCPNNKQDTRFDYENDNIERLTSYCVRRIIIEE